MSKKHHHNTQIQVCNKAKFSKVEAQTKLNSLVESGEWNKKDNRGRIYPCPFCKGFWHITSLIHEKKDNFKSSPLQLQHIDKWNKLITNH